MSGTVDPTYPVAGRLNVIVWGCGSGGGGGAGSTDIESWTSGAGSHVASPGWEAVTVHVPWAMRSRTPPVTAQVDGVFDAKLTGRPDVEVAARSIDDPTTSEAGRSKLIVCGVNAAAGPASSWAVATLAIRATATEWRRRL